MFGLDYTLHTTECGEITHCRLLYSCKAGKVNQLKSKIIIGICI